ncbi:SAM-dependent methyltransferase [Nonomuraea sp. NPDC050556]|uniref:SAM-dependent methyltransferase n=1 Tax=Nonomuraea sp. NPDC050556 TaxID=3364369 RepID=UPI00379E2148
MAIPARLSWAVEVLQPRPGEQILELGCGNGVAVQLVCDSGATVTAVDRSATAIAAATARNAGRARLIHGTLADVDGVYDKVFAVNVNLFWVRSPAPELRLLDDLLARDGELYLFYEPPADRPLGEKVGAVLAEHGYQVAVTSRPPLVCVRGRR